jgi:hypothetical protein
VAGRTGSERIGCGHSRVWLPVYRGPLPIRGQPKVFDGMLLRATVTGHGLAGGEIPPRLASGLLTVAPRAPLGLLARRGHAPKGDGVHDVVGAGAAVVLARVPLSGHGAPDVRAKASAGVHVRGGVFDTGLARHGVDTNSAAALRPAPWVAADTTAAVGLERVWERRLAAKRVLAGQEGGAPSSVSACARQPATARPWRRGRRGASWRSGSREGPKAQPRLRGYCARVLGCMPTRGRRGPHGRARDRERDANANTMRIRWQRREGDQDGVAPYG